MACNQSRVCVGSSGSCVGFRSHDGRRCDVLRKTLYAGRIGAADSGSAQMSGSARRSGNPLFRLILIAVIAAAALVAVNGLTFLALYRTTIEELNVGMVAKTDLAEIQASFIKAGSLAGGGTLAITLIGAGLMARLGSSLFFQLKENEERLRAIVSTAADGIVTITERGTIESFNTAAERIFCYAP